MMRSIIDGFLLAFSYFTVLPTFKQNLQLNKSTYSSMLFFTPFCGLIISLITVYIAYTLSDIFAPLYGLLVACIIYLFLYGFLHLEAIADVIDAWMAKYSNKDIYEIMKEPHIGSIGAIGTFCFILLKVASMVFLLIQEQFFILITVVILSRLSIIYNLKFFAFHEKSFFAQSLKQSATPTLLIISLIVYTALGLYLVDIKIFLILFACSILFSVVILKILQKRFGFLNGDCMGSSIEVTELLLLNVGLLL